MYYSLKPDNIVFGFLLVWCKKVILDLLPQLLDEFRFCSMPFKVQMFLKLDAALQIIMQSGEFIKA